MNEKDENFLARWSKRKLSGKTAETIDDSKEIENLSEDESPANYGEIADENIDDEITDEEFREVKKSMGDIDITIPHGDLKPLFDLLADNENQRITKDFIYLGQNKKTQHGHQINSVFQLQSPKIKLTNEKNYKI